MSPARRHLGSQQVSGALSSATGDPQPHVSQHAFLVPALALSRPGHEDPITSCCHKGLHPVQNSEPARWSTLSDAHPVMRWAPSWWRQAVLEVSRYWTPCYYTHSCTPTPSPSVAWAPSWWQRGGAGGRPLTHIQLTHAHIHRHACPLQAVVRAAAGRHAEAAGGAGGGAPACAVGGAHGPPHGPAAAAQPGSRWAEGGGCRSADSMKECSCLSNVAERR